jgi:hypothetical protein
MWENNLKMSTKALMLDIQSKVALDFEFAERYGDLDWDEIGMYIPLSKLKDHISKINAMGCCLLTDDDIKTYDEYRDQMRCEYLTEEVEYYSSWLVEQDILKNYYKIGPFLED